MPLYAAFFMLLSIILFLCDRKGNADIQNIQKQGKYFKPHP